MVMLDTDHLSLLERGDQPGGGALRARLAPLPPAEVVTTIISADLRQVPGLRVEDWTA